MGLNKLHKVIPDFWENPMSHPIWKDAEIQTVKPTHYEPRNSTDRFAFSLVRVVRSDPHHLLTPTLFVVPRTAHSPFPLAPIS